MRLNWQAQKPRRPAQSRDRGRAGELGVAEGIADAVGAQRVAVGEGAV